MSLDGLRNLMLDDLGKHLERLFQQKRDDVLTQAVELVVGRDVEKMADAYLAAVERQEASADSLSGRPAPISPAPGRSTAAVCRRR